MPEPVTAYDDDGRAGAQETPPPPPASAETEPPFQDDPALVAATSRFARLAVQLEAVDPELAAELEALVEETARTPVDFDALSERALERLTRPEPAGAPPTAPAPPLEVAS